MKNSINTCEGCEKKYIVMADVAYLETEYFCFNTYEEARDCFDRIERHKAYGGLQFLPKSAVLLKPKEE